MFADDNYQIINRLVLLGQFCSAGLALARSCKAQGIAVYLLELTNQEAKWRHYSSCLSGGDVIRYDEIGTVKGISIINRYLNRVGAEALAVGCHDSIIAWLAQNKRKFSSACKVMVPPISSITKVSSKQKQLNLSKNLKLENLPMWPLLSSADYETIPPENFPVCLRPSDEESVKPTFKAKVIHSPKEILICLESLRFLGHPVIAQPFQSLPNLVVHIVRSETGQILAIKSFLVSRKFEGIAMTIENIEPIMLPSKLEKQCREFADASGIIGCFHFDFLFSVCENRAYFLEVNIRLGGTTDKVMKMGFDEPALLLAAYGLKGPAKARFYRRSYNRITNKRAVMKHILAVLKGRISEIDYPASSRFKHLRYSIFDLCFTKDSVFDWKDLRGSLWFYSQRPVEPIW